MVAAGRAVSSSVSPIEPPSFGLAASGLAGVAPAAGVGPGEGEGTRAGAAESAGVEPADAGGEGAAIGAAGAGAGVGDGADACCARTGATNKASARQSRPATVTTPVRALRWRIIARPFLPGGFTLPQYAGKRARRQAGKLAWDGESRSVHAGAGFCQRRIGWRAARVSSRR